VADIGVRQRFTADAGDPPMIAHGGSNVSIPISGASLVRACRRLPTVLVWALVAACARPSAEQASSRAATGSSPAAGSIVSGAAPGAAITEADLRRRIAIFADDSMMGRNAPLEGDRKGAEYLASELRRLGLEPAGDNGTYFQSVPSIDRAIDRDATLSLGGQRLRYDVDFVPASRSTPRPIEDAQVIYGGSLDDPAAMISRQQATGKFVVVTVSPSTPGATRPTRYVPRLATAAGIAVVNLDLMSGSERAALNAPDQLFAANAGGSPLEGPIVVHVTRAAAERMLGGSIADRAVGATGPRIRGQFRLVSGPSAANTARNVVAILRGSDEKLRGQYVAIGAHKDHVGFNSSPVDHDSLRMVLLAQHRAQIARRRPTEADLRVDVDSLRRLRPARPDSIANGADDDGSGSMAMLEIAEAMVNSEPKPRRSVLFVWHTGEEDGLLGSRHFTDHPTVPADSIVAQINVDMIGRGTAQDVKGGGPDYLIVVGHRRMSQDLGDIVDSVNARQRRPLRFDLSWDAPDHPEGIYDRSDHANYARIGIPVAFFFTGLHADYHQVTDEPQYLDYPHYTRITQYLHDLTRAIADRTERVRVDAAAARSRR
jgi:hypothetical protein